MRRMQCQRLDQLADCAFVAFSSLPRAALPSFVYPGLFTFYPFRIMALKASNMNNPA